MPDGSSTAHLYKPKLISILKEGYGLAHLRQDVLAAVTVAIVALPLSMAIAVASGVSPERGLYTAIVGGFLVSALSGSRFQIGGPAGAFIVLVAATMSAHGIEGLLLAVLLSGLLLAVTGAIGLGTLIRHIPQPVIVGFTLGIAVTIFASQLKELGGLQLSGTEPGPFFEKMLALAGAVSTINPVSLVLGTACAATIFFLRRWRPQWPTMLIAVVAVSVIAALLHLPVETIGARFGELPHGLPNIHFPVITFDLIVQILPAAISFTLLGGIESLLSAKVADGMTGRKHRSNMELVAQGIANMGSALFGGISVTGTIARTATNVRAGAHSPISGMLHAIFILLFMLVAAPLASYVPLTALAGVLLVVCWNMIERDELRHMMQQWRSAAILIVTFAVTLIEDLTFGIAAGCIIALLIHWLTPKTQAL